MNRSILLGIILVVFSLGGFIFFVNQKSQTPNMEGKTIPGYSGKVLAGNVSFFLEFNKEDFEKALKSDKIILLDFYANWCPICRAEKPEIYAGFNSLTHDKIIGFRVNFNDSETDEDERKLAKDFNVPYQHTKVFLKNGKEVLRSVDQWSKDQFIKEVETTINN